MSQGSVFEDDPFGNLKKERRSTDSLEPREVNKLHARSDVDSSVNAQHHTLGIKHTQSSPGDHSHDGKSSRLIGTGLGLTVTGSKGGNVALANLLTMLKSVIDFTDATT